MADPILIRISDAAALGHRGDPSGARRALAGLWAEVGDQGDPLHRLALAHALADVQEDPAEELRWDKRALEAAADVSDERAQEAGMATSVAALYPSLHLNIGDAYRKLGQLEDAARHCAAGLAAASALDDDGYGALVRGGLERLARRVEGG